MDWFYKRSLQKLRLYERFIKILGAYEQENIGSLDLITLAVRHLKAKRARTIITIGGMAVGFGAIVFLLSIGYGSQRLVVSRVARLEEMRQTDVSIGQASSLFLNESTIEDFKKIEGVDLVLPMISVVSKVGFKSSVSDVVAYGVTSEFLEQSAIQPTKGRIFVSENDLSYQGHEKGEEKVAGVKTEVYGQAKTEKEIGQIGYSINPLVWKPVYEKPSLKALIVGQTKRNVGQQEAKEVWGNSYPSLGDYASNGVDDYGNYYGRWVKDTFPLWEEKKCDLGNTDCVEGEYLVLRDASVQVLREGFITEENVQVAERFEIVSEDNPVVAEGEILAEVEFLVKPEIWVTVYSEHREDSMPIGFTKLTSPIRGDLVLGDSYLAEGDWGKVEQNANDKWLGCWLSASFPLWGKLECQDCGDDYFLVKRDENSVQVASEGFIQAGQVDIDNMPEFEKRGKVLAEATQSAELVLEDETATQSAFLNAETGWVEIASKAGVISDTKKEILKLSDGAKKEAVINRVMARLLGIDDDVLSQTFMVTFILNGELLGEEDHQAESEEVEYKIIGVIPDERTPAFYLPFGDLKGVGIKNYSQVKVVVDSKDKLREVRSAIEGMGFKTSSVVDTVGRINSLFANIRIVLVLLGLIALGVAALGMFNTLTVSLLEKTREVGLMKAMGMESHEIQRLFLAESVIMGFLGGVFGIILGFLAGKIVSLLLSLIAMTKGIGVLDVAHIPPVLILLIVILSSLIGIFTGIFPARRATKISALNALRYE